MKFKFNLFFLVVFMFCQHLVKAQIFFGTSFIDANCSQDNSSISNYSNLDYTLDLKYQYKFANVNLSWGRDTRINEINSDVLKTNADKLALTINALPLNGTNPTFSPGLGIGCYARIPFEVDSKTGIHYDDYYAIGVTGNLAMNFIDEFGFISTGIKFDRDISISSGEDKLKLSDYGFFIAANMNLSHFLKK